MNNMHHVSYENNKPTRSTAMSTSEPSFQYQGRRRFFVAALAVLSIGAASYGIRSGLALAEEPPAASPSRATTPPSVPLRNANADVDVGPGQCEPCVVGSP